MPYMLAPGARLEVGPGGKLMETLGELPVALARMFGQRVTSSAPIQIDADTGNAVGAACLQAGTCKPKKGSPADLRSRAPAPEVTPTTDGGAVVSYSAQTAAGGISPVVLIGGAAVVGLGLLYLMKRKRR